MASSEQVRFLHQANDSLHQAVLRELSAVVPNLHVVVRRHDQPRTLFHELVRLDGFDHVKGRSRDLLKQNIQVNLEQYGVVNVLAPRDFWFGVGYYGDEVLHFLEARQSLVVKPASPTAFTPLLYYVRRQIESGDAVQPEAPQTEDKRGCAVAILALGAGGLPWLGHLTGIL